MALLYYSDWMPRVDERTTYRKGLSEVGDFFAGQPVKPDRGRGGGRNEVDEPDPRHWWKTAMAASFPT
ncbi:hypothetical protein LMG23994_05914 [Cupriavidus pinatubonensis]|uniref:Uncharacterized protein n=1 Tax=Cupriavidus pinatubonensis TaxID=248026 RepID=A0ABM8XZM4_9BURK|nr:hypothetical protein LMG23994_05914 [Cupriavidus pinatubonensis]